MNVSSSVRRGAVIAAVAAAFVAGTMVVPSVAERNTPANKVSAAGSTREVMGPNDDYLLFSEQIKTSNPTDLILGITLECSITTNLTTVGNDSAFASGTVDLWVVIDGGDPVMVSSDDTNDGSGEVTFCSRSYQRNTSMFDDEDATIETFLETKTAHAFNWMAFDVGSAVHTIEVWARLTQETAGDATAEAVVGKRTFIIEPTKAANDEVITELDT